MAIMSSPILGRGHSGWSHLRGVVLSKQDYHLYTMKCATQSEATTKGREGITLNWSQLSGLLLFQLTIKFADSQFSGLHLVIHSLQKVT